MTDVIVLGAGIVGVSSALQLQRAGVDVLLVDNGAPEDATSFGNAGVIQSEAAEPYAFPRDPVTILRMLAGLDNHLTYTLTAILSAAGPLLAYWRHSKPSKHLEISSVYWQLIRSVLDDHNELITLSGAEDLVTKKGYLIVSRNGKTLEHEIQEAERLRNAYGIESEALNPDGLRKLEPNLNLPGGGGILWTSPWTISDPAGLVSSYRAAFEKLGGTFAFGDAASLTNDAISGWKVETKDGTHTAENTVLCLGAATAVHAQRFEHYFPLIRKTGYHQHYDRPDELLRPVLDLEHGYVMAPMRTGLRLTTGVSLCTRSASEPRQLIRARKAASELIGKPLQPVSGVWSGVRPCTPDMLPVVGESNRHRGLWFNFGHGHQGLTLGPTTGRILADQLRGKNSLSPVELSLSCSRFSS